MFFIIVANYIFLNIMIAFACEHFKVCDTREFNQLQLIPQRSFFEMPANCTAIITKFDKFCAMLKKVKQISNNADMKPLLGNFPPNNPEGLGSSKESALTNRLVLWMHQKDAPNKLDNEIVIQYKDKSLLLSRQECKELLRFDPKIYAECF